MSGPPKSFEEQFVNGIVEHSLYEKVEKLEKQIQFVMRLLDKYGTRLSCDECGYSTHLALGMSNTGWVKFCTFDGCNSLVCDNCKPLHNIAAHHSQQSEKK
jgi:hypothetical protein